MSFALEIKQLRCPSTTFSHFVPSSLRSEWLVKKKFVNSEEARGKLYPWLRIWQNGNLLLFLSSFAFQLTKIVILLRNHIYMCFVAARNSNLLWLILNNSFISLYDVHVFQEFPSSSCRRRFLWNMFPFSTAHVFRLRQGRTKKIQQQFHDSLAISSNSQ